MPHAEQYLTGRRTPCRTTTLGAARAARGTPGAGQGTMPGSEKPASAIKMLVKTKVIKQETWQTMWR